jgi:hypothetical protein
MFGEVLALLDEVVDAARLVIGQGIAPGPLPQASQAGTKVG